ncbi:hypothetical protein IV102_25775 [bacterium]|nr:hypothetical protein [bacterium]
MFEKEPGSGVWWILYHANGKRHREKIGSKSAATEAYLQRKSEIRHKKFRPESVGYKSPSVDQLMDRYADYFAGLRSPMQHLRHRRRWSKFLGDQLADDIKPGDIRAFMRKQVKTPAPATVNLELAYLSKVFSLAMDDELIARNPCKVVKKLKINNQRLRWLNSEEEAQLRPHFEAEDWEIVELGILTGLRRGELFELRRTDAA